jgi:prolyl oligopeptidase
MAVRMAVYWLVHEPYIVASQVVTVSIGLLVSACVNRAPEGLFGAAVAEVGVHDLLKVGSHTTRFFTHFYDVSLFKFADFTIGHAWTSDYGNPHDPHDFDFIYPISPVHNVPTNKILPAMLLLTADRA